MKRGEKETGGQLQQLVNLCINAYAHNMRQIMRGFSKMLDSYRHASHTFKSYTQRAHLKCLSLTKKGRRAFPGECVKTLITTQLSRILHIVQAAVDVDHL